ncbi:MAG: ABC transporter [Gammaproteobacteria bacterium RIFCSPLOWO2_12_FULL_52_10]|nr:MAG: ABC transporter [Gammaproteobacteria bacterium RIFCSPLOWO2_12_FULL_52_10]
MKALEIKDLKKIYANGNEALKGIDLEIDAGDFFALLGPNGAGKSTTIGIISSLVRKTSGRISIFGYDLDNDTFAAKSSIGIVPQELNFSQFETSLEIVLNQAGYYGIPRRVALQRAQQYLGQMDLWDKRNDASRTLSGGLKRRLMIARALMNEPRLLILDEPTAGVDVELRRSMWDFLTAINKTGITILLTTHYLEEAENLCKSIAIIDKGRLIENTSMKILLSKLNTEIFILDLEQELDQLPDIPGFELRLLDSTTLQAELRKGQRLNELFQRFTEYKIQVRSMRNKSNRLEELFIRLVKANPQSATVPGYEN